MPIMSPTLTTKGTPVDHDLLSWSHVELGLDLSFFMGINPSQKKENGQTKR